MKNILPLLLCLTLLLATATMVVAENGPTTIDMAGKSQPKVTFTHASHQAHAADCKTCHHMGVGNGSCKGCHGRDSRFADAKTAIHNSCNGCHEKRGVAAASNCSFCHVPTAATSPTDSWRDRWRDKRR